MNCSFALNSNFRTIGEKEGVRLIASRWSLEVERVIVESSSLDFVVYFSTRMFSVISRRRGDVVYTWAILDRLSVERILKLSVLIISSGYIESTSVIHSEIGPSSIIVICWVNPNRNSWFNVGEGGTVTTSGQNEVLEMATFSRSRPILHVDTSLALWVTKDCVGEVNKINGGGHSDYLHPAIRHNLHFDCMCRHSSSHDIGETLLENINPPLVGPITFMTIVRGLDIQFIVTGAHKSDGCAARIVNKCTIVGLSKFNLFSEAVDSTRIEREWT